MGHSFSKSTCGLVSYVLEEAHHQELGSFVSVPLFWGLCLTQLLGLRPRRWHGGEGSTMLSAALFPSPLLTEQRPENARSEVLDEWSLQQKIGSVLICFSDECEEVEHQCQKTIQQLEAILGEPLQSYFWTFGVLGFLTLFRGQIYFSYFYFWVFGTILLLVPWHLCGLLYKIPTWFVLPQKPLRPPHRTAVRVNDSWYLYTDCCVCQHLLRQCLNFWLRFLL